jgi:hypothetical protein
MEKSIDIGQELTLPSVRDPINQLAVVIGHCDLLSDHLKAGSECAQRVSAIQEIAQGIAKGLNKYQCRVSESATERVAAVLRRCAGGIVEGWLAHAKESRDLTSVPLSDGQRAVHIPRLVEDLAIRLSESSAVMKDSSSAAAEEHGKLRYRQGYTPAMLVNESRIMEVTVFGMLDLLKLSKAVSGWGYGNDSRQTWPHRRNCLILKRLRLDPFCEIGHRLKTLGQ